MPAHTTLTPVLTVAEVNALIASVFPQLNEGSRNYEAVEVFPGGCTVRLNAGEQHLRPGGTVSGPTMFGLADVAFYFALMSRIGLQALAVTTNVSIDFLRKPMPDADLLGEARLLKIGRQLAAGDVLIRSEGQEEVVARAGLTFSIPPQK